MALAVLALARECLHVQGRVSIHRDFFTLRDLPPPRSLKSELEFVRTARCLPERPTDLHVVNVSEDGIDLAWTDNSDNESGFAIQFRGKRAGFEDHVGRDGPDAPDRTEYRLGGIRGGFQYTMSVVAYNARNDDSAASNEVQATTPIVEEVIDVDLIRQEIFQGFTPYRGEFPSFGTARGRLLRIRVPQTGLLEDLDVLFVRPGHSTAECGNSDATVVVGEGESTIPAQIESIFGVSEPEYDTLNHLIFVVCIGTAGPSPDRVPIEITVLPA